MQIARVVTHVVTTRKHHAYTGRKLLLARPVDSRGRYQGEPVVAIDLVDAGKGDLVLISSEGRWARECFGSDAPVRSTIVAVVGGVDYAD